MRTERFAKAVTADADVVIVDLISIDLATELGVSPEDREALLSARSSLVFAAAAARVTHHGLSSSNNPTLVLAIDPVVAVMCNGPTKGGDPQTLATLRRVKSLAALYQLHRNVKLKPDEQTPAEFIANTEPTADCRGVWVKSSVAPDGKSYTVQIGPDGAPRTYQTRDQ